MPENLEKNEAEYSDIGPVDEVPLLSLEDEAEGSAADDESATPKKPGDFEKELDKSVAVFLQDLSSEEHVKDKLSRLLKPLLSGVSLTVSAGEVWGISSRNVMSTRVLCQIIGSMRSYGSGICRLGPLGTMKIKRRILPHLFYIDSHEMIYQNKTVLEQFMFSTKQANNVFGDVDRQIRLLKLLEDMGMGYIALSTISDLYDTEKLLVTLLIASESDSGLIVCDWTDYTFSQPEIEILEGIMERLRYLDKAVVIGTMQAKLIGMVCDKTLFIYNGEPIYCGSVEELYSFADKVAFVLNDKNPQRLGRSLSYLLPGWQVRVSGDNLYLYNYTDTPMSAEAFYRLLSDNGLSPDYIKVNLGRVENSFEELVEQYDLQK